MAAYARNKPIKPMSLLPASSADPRTARRLFFLFGLAYFAQSFAQMGGLIGQPLNFYLKQEMGLSPGEVSEYLAIASMPWVIKPLYGLVSDYLPLFGYRRKSWLMLVNLFGAGGFLWLSGLADPGSLVVALTLTAFGTAASDVIIDALMVEKGAETGLTARFLGTQWFWFKLAAVATALAGGFLANSFSPATALHIAATLTMLAPIAVLTASYFLVQEKPSRIELAAMKETSQSMWLAVRSPKLQLAAAFLVLWCFSPGFGTPLYFHMTDVLHFDQQFIGQLSAFTAVGGVIGAWIFGHALARRSFALQANVAIGAAILAVLAYLALARPSGYMHAIAAPLHVSVGMLNQIGMLMILSVAARACPPRAEGFTFAVMMSLYNAADQFSSVVGSRLYEQVFHQSLGPLLWVAAGSLALCFLLVPRLARQHAQRPAPLWA
ncbi:MAG: MFS transporter [Pseudomonadota bacterium]